MAATRCRSASRACLALRISAIGQPERCVEWCRTQLARGRDTHTFTRACLVIRADGRRSREEAMAAATGLIDAAEATHNPYALSFALLAYGFAFRDADPDRALDALRRGLVIAQDSGNRGIEIIPGGQSVPGLRPSTATRWPRSITSRWRSATTTTRATPPLSVPPGWRSPPFSTGSDATKRRPPSPVSPSIP